MLGLGLVEINFYFCALSICVLRIKYCLYNKKNNNKKRGIGPGLPTPRHGSTYSPRHGSTYAPRHGSTYSPRHGSIPTLLRVMGLPTIRAIRAYSPRHGPTYYRPESYGPTLRGMGLPTIGLRHMGLISEAWAYLQYIPGIWVEFKAVIVLLAITHNYRYGNYVGNAPVGKVIT